MGSRRNLLKGAVAVGSVALTGTGIEQTVDAARRGYGGPSAANSSTGLRFEISIIRNDAFAVVRLPSTGPSPYSVTIVNRTPFELDLDIFLLRELMYTTRISANTPELVELSQSGNYQFAVASVDGPVMLNWDASVPNPA